MISKETSQALANGIRSYLAERRDKKEQEYLKKASGKKKKGINTRLTALVKLISDDEAAIKSIEKSKKTKEQSALSFQQEKFKSLLALISDDVINDDLTALKSEYLTYLAELNEQHIPANWLDGWVDKAKDISFATHVAKLTHSSSKGSSILDTSGDRNIRYLTTNSLAAPEWDTAADNAASLPIANILKISDNGVSVLDCLKNNDCTFFEEITNDKTKIQNWVKSLRQAYDSDKKKSYFLSKQIYFPLHENNYHLLLPLTSSSLAQAMHLEHQKYFDTEQKVARAQRKESKHSITTIISYPNKAKLNITASNHSNASKLNGFRGGKVTLLSSHPPQWQGHPISYRQSDKFFTKQLAYHLEPEIKELETYIQLLTTKQLSYRHPDRAKALQKKIKAINNAIFDLVLLINKNEQQSSWTLECALPIENQLLFEPWREDDKAKAEKRSGNWQTTVCNQFSIWLNRQLNKNKKLFLTPIHAVLWAQIFARDLRAFVAVQEVSV